MTTSHIIDVNYDIKLVLTQSGNEISGTIQTTCTYAYLHPGYGNWDSPLGHKSSNTVSGTMSGNDMTLTCYSPASSGTSNGVAYTTDASSITWSLTLNGSRLTSSSSYYDAGMGPTDYTFDLKSGDDGGVFGSLTLGNGSLTVPAIIAVIGGGACLVASFIPLPKGNVVPAANGASYQPSDVRTVSVDSGAPSAGTPVGGVGLTYPQDYVNGVPVKPKYWQSQQHGPQCPIHGTMCNANYPNAQDPGAWFCPKCAEQGRDGFPWGRN